MTNWITDSPSSTRRRIISPCSSCSRRARGLGRAMGGWHWEAVSDSLIRCRDSWNPTSPADFGLSRESKGGEDGRQTQEARKPGVRVLYRQDWPGQVQPARQDEKAHTSTAGGSSVWDTVRRVIDDWLEKLSRIYHIYRKIYVSAVRLGASGYSIQWADKGHGGSCHIVPHVPSWS